MNGRVVSDSVAMNERLECGTIFNNFKYVISPTPGTTTNNQSEIDTVVTLNQTTAYTAGPIPEPSTFTTRFTVSAPWTEDQTLRANTTETFSGVFDDFSRFRLNYSRGTLLVESSTGDSLSLTAGTTTGNEHWFAESIAERGTFTARDVWGILIDLPYLDEFDCEIF